MAKAVAAGDKAAVKQLLMASHRPKEEEDNDNTSFISHLHLSKVGKKASGKAQRAAKTPRT